MVFNKKKGGRKQQEECGVEPQRKVLSFPKKEEQQTDFEEEKEA